MTGASAALQNQLAFIVKQVEELTAGMQMSMRQNESIQEQLKKEQDRVRQLESELSVERGKVLGYQSIINRQRASVHSVERQRGNSVGGSAADRLQQQQQQQQQQAVPPSTHPITTQQLQQQTMSRSNTSQLGSMDPRPFLQVPSPPTRSRTAVQILRGSDENIASAAGGGSPGAVTPPQPIQRQNSGRFSPQTSKSRLGTAAEAQLKRELVANAGLLQELMVHNKMAPNQQGSEPQN